MCIQNSPLSLNGLDQAAEKSVMEDSTGQANSERNSQVCERKMGHFTGYHLVLLR
jgi:hypothetical protein